MSTTQRRRPGQVSLERALSKRGIASRTVANQWIREGKVNGVIRLDPGFPTNPDTAKIEVDGVTQRRTEFKAILLHKPRGVVTTRSDEKGRPTVFSVLPAELQKVHLVSVGRLDFATTGLLILTNDTRLAAWLTDPENAIQRVYIVSVRGAVSDESIQRMKDGIQDQGEILKADQVELLKKSERESRLKVTLTEGKNREIRRLFLSQGHEVTQLKRISFGELELDSLPIGQIRDIPLDEIKALFPDAEFSTTLDLTDLSSPVKL